MDRFQRSAPSFLPLIRAKDPHKRARGFTLLETMIALMIVAVALPALVTLVMTQLDGSAAIRDKTYAYWVAENQLTRIRLLQQQKMLKAIPDYTLPTQESGEVEMAGLEWHWEMRTVDMESLPVKGFKRVEIAVRLKESGSRISGPSSDGDAPALARLNGYIGDPREL